MSDLPDAVTRRSAYPFALDHAIRWGDTDKLGHVNNAAYATYFEVARTELLHGDLAELMAGGLVPVMARLVINFHRELHWPGGITVTFGVLGIGRSSVRTAQAVFQGEDCAASGEAVFVLIDEGTRKAVPWEAGQRALLQRYALA